MFLRLTNPETFNAVRINDDFGCVEWPGGIDLCPEAMHRTMTGAQSEVELDTAAALREAPKAQ